MTPAIIGADMRAMRRAVGLTQKKLATLMGFSVGRVKCWEADCPFMPDEYVPLFLDVIMARMAEREGLVQLVIIARQKVLPPPSPKVLHPRSISRSIIDLPLDLSPSSSVS
jgi:hypothetical protein